MAWRYPVHDLATDYVVDIDPINDNFLAVTEEVSGYLNEHNFRADENMITRDELSKDAAFILHHSYFGVVSITDYNNRSGWVTIRAVDTWQTFGVEGLSKTLLSSGGTLWICASLNAHAGTGDNMDAQKGYGWLFALKLNGVILNETILGTGDAQQEWYQGAIGAEPSDADFTNPQGGGGLSGARLPVVIDTVVEVPPGRHLIEVAILNIRGSMQSDPIVPHTNTYVTNREIFILEMLR
jgi:hypothetical protein